MERTGEYRTCSENNLKCFIYEVGICHKHDIFSQSTVCLIIEKCFVFHQQPYSLPTSLPSWHFTQHVRPQNEGDKPGFSEVSSGD